MKVSELLKILSKVNPDAAVYIEADHGQTPEHAGSVHFAANSGELPYYGDNLSWCDKMNEQNTTAILLC